ncbi:hypothetical protein NEPAR08_0488 [Nematocida parisii]|nr:hypothetical protein NEPAR03_0499 [Nematocida parisii]KAI5126497.1 hypothetical protein NEPAR08_0488 [Nematocida parisii]
MQKLKITMRQLKKVSIITGLICICIDTIICGGFKASYKSRHACSPYSLEQRPRNNSLHSTDSADTNELTPQKSMHSNDNGKLPLMNNQSEIEANLSLDLFNSSETHNSVNNKKLSDNNDQTMEYTDADHSNADTTYSGVNDSAAEVYGLPAIHTDIDHNPTNTLSSSKKSIINRKMRMYINDHLCVIRNYTSYIENNENIDFLRSNKDLLIRNVFEKSKQVIEEWKKDTTTDIWTMVKNVGIDFSLTKRFFNNIEKSNPYIINMPNPFCYNRFLNDLTYYINNYGQTVYYRQETHNKSYRKKKETLGDIWINKEINIYCCCSGIDRQIVTEGADKDIKLKKKLNTIFYIPEIYEDFYKIPVAVVSRFFQEFELETYKSFPLNDNNARHRLLGVKHIIIYLICIAQKEEAMAEQLYKEVKKIKTLENNSRTIEEFTAIEVYSLIYSIVDLFYEYFGVTYKLDRCDQYRIRNRTPLLHINSMYSRRTYSKVLGFYAMTKQKYLKFSTTLVEINEIENSDYDRIVKTTHTMEGFAFTEDNALLSVKDHYHVQFVDNVNHTIEMIHLPYYIHKQENGEIKKHQPYAIHYIVVYLKLMFNIGVSPLYSKFGDIYPFKYKRNSKTWSLITKRSELNKTVEMIEKEDCNVVFYYIKERIYETKFCFAQFVYSPEVRNEVNDENIDKPRIPLFLPIFMVSAFSLGPYNRSTINRKVFNLHDFKNLQPITYIQTYIVSFDSELPISDVQEKNSNLLLINRHMKESDLNYAIKHYYSDFFIRNSTDFYEDFQCYCMNIQQGINRNYGNAIITWNVRNYSSVYEYTTYKFDSKIKDERTHLGAIKQPAIASFIGMLQNKNPSMNMAMYGYCIYKTNCDKEDYKTSAVFCLTMKDLLERLNKYLINLNKQEKIIDPISEKPLFLKNYNPKFILKDISSAIMNSTLEQIKNSPHGIISVRDNNYNGCKYGIHYDIMNLLTYDRSIPFESHK